MAAYVTPPRNMCGTCLHPWVYPHRKVFISCNQGPLSLHHILLSGKGFAMWTVNRIPWLVQIQLVQILFSQVASNSSLKWMGWMNVWCPGQGARDSSCPALSGDHDTSVTKQRDATNCYCCCTKYLLSEVVHFVQQCIALQCCAAQTVQNKDNSFLEAALDFRSPYSLLEVPLRSLAWTAAVDVVGKVAMQAWNITVEYRGAQEFDLRSHCLLLRKRSMQCM